ncbi:RNA methyltransferase [Nocardioides sp.]|uniref:TrmH family RNA methyltransferase n=1 Tax=Nocardioides sp. TaxID=35761 RepID=UPI002736E249|nr:RNA methyltransferase [Nocardioides sp.]MDP3892210.1 RNA methyltransferase [Nocardioides sp.]
MASFRSDPPPLTSGNSRVKDARKLARRASRAERRTFLADGPKAVEAALLAEGCLLEVFATAAASEQYAELRAASPRWSVVDDRALASLSDAVHPQGLVGVCRFIDRPLGHLLSGATASSAGPRLVTICADVRDPGNAGTVIRCADAAGGDIVVLAGHSVDAYNPKTVRATAGSLFHVPLAIEPSPADAVATVQGAGLVVLAADGAGELDLDEAIDTGLLRSPTAWLFGNEAWGLPEELAALADHRVRIPLHGRAESLNLSTAAAVCLYASARAQRR